MPGMRCTCGQRIGLGEIPCPNEYRFMSDEDLDKLPHTVASDELHQRMTSFLKCPKCGRLHVFWKGYGELPMVYAPEDSTTPPSG